MGTRSDELDNETIGCVAWVHLLAVGSATGGAQAIMDTAWRAARENGIACMAWACPDVPGGSGLLYLRSDGSLEEHALALLRHCQAASEARARNVPTVRPVLPEGGAAERVLARAGLAAVLAVPVDCGGAARSLCVFGTKEPGGLTQARTVFLCALAAAMAWASLREANPSSPSPQRDRLSKELLDRTPTLVLAVDPAGTVVAMNRACEDVTGISAPQALGRRCDEVLSKLAGDLDLGVVVRQVYRSGIPATVCTQGNWGGAQSVAVEWQVSRLSYTEHGLAGVALVGTNVTERMRVEQELQRVGKLALAGESLASAAHELNNPLTAVVGFAELLEGQIAQGPERQYLSHLVAQARRCRRIVSSLLSLFRNQRPHREPVSVNDLILETTEFMAYQCALNRVELCTSLAPNLPPVFADPHELQQVLINLLTNAQQALLEQGGGTVEVRTFGEEGCVHITVCDNGPGVPEEFLPRIFEPFVTTKPDGIGTGLGLSISRGIVEQHGGRMTAANRPEGGACFTVSLPSMERSRIVTLAPEPRKQAESVPASAHGSGKVLVVDDEEPLRLLMAELLSHLGYQTDETDDGTTALDLIARNDYDLVICDLKMPGLSGEELYERVQSTRPELACRIIFATGDTGSRSARDFFERTGCAYIGKPFSLSQLVEAINTCLQRPGVPRTVEG